MLQLHARVTGEGAPVVLLHGLFGSLENLGGIAQRLAGYQCVHALDLRNHGRSPHCDAMDYPLMAGDVLRYLDQAGLDRVWLLGHSMGGKTAMTLALQAPDRIRGVIVGDIAPVTYPPHHDGILEGLQSLDPATLDSRQDADARLRRWVPETPVRQFLLKNLIKTDAGRFGWRLNLPAIVRHYGQILAGQQAETPYIGPVLFIKGGLSDYIQPAHRAHTASLFPSAQLKIIPGTGHWLHADKPELFARLCLQFLEQSGAAA